MTVGVTYSADGVPLNHPLNYWWLEDDIPVGLNLQRRGINMMMPGLDGAISQYDETNETTQLGLKFIVNATKGHNLTQSYWALMAVLNKRSNYITLSRQMFGETVSCSAKLAAITDTTRIETGDSMRFTAVFTIPGVWWRGVDTYWTQDKLHNGWTYNVTTLAGTVGEIRDAYVRFIGPMTNPMITDVATGAGFSGPNVANGKQLLVDCNTGRAWLNPVAKGWAIGSLPSGSDVTSDLRCFGRGSGRRTISLTPAPNAADPFDRQVKVKFNHGGPLTTASKLEIRAHRTFL